MKTLLSVLLSGFFFFIIFTQPSLAQQQDEYNSVEQQKSALNNLSHWIGEWEGTGWSTKYNLDKTFELMYRRI